MWYDSVVTTNRVWEARQAAKRKRTLSQLDKGRLFKIAGGALYRVNKIRSNGEINAWGPLHKGGLHATMRTFKLDDVKEIISG